MEADGCDSNGGAFWNYVAVCIQSELNYDDDDDDDDDDDEMIMKQWK